MAEPISAGTLAAIAAISALGQASGAGFSAAAGAGAADRDRKYREKMDLIALQEREKDRGINESRYQDGRMDARRAEVHQQPMNSVGLLTGLSNLSQGMGRSNPLDVLGYLAR